MKGLVKKYTLRGLDPLYRDIILHQSLSEPLEYCQSLLYRTQEDICLLNFLGNHRKQKHLLKVIKAEIWLLERALYTWFEISLSLGPKYRFKIPPLIRFTSYSIINALGSI